MSITRLALVTLAALAIATPASAQLGGLKKKIKGEPTAQGGTVVLTADVVNQLLTGLKAGKAEREAAAREDTPYGRYMKAEAAYAQAQTKCAAAQQSFYQRAAGDQKLMDKYSGFIDKMGAAQSKGDLKLMAIYQDSAAALQDPSCVVKKPEQPKDTYDAEREIEIRAEKAEVKASGLSANELAMAKERTDAILRGATAADISASEKSAVSAKAAELKPLMGIQEQPATRAQKTEPAPAPAPAAAAAPAPNPQASAAASDMGSCMAKNAQAHQAELEALGNRVQAAHTAGDQAKMMVIADTIQQIQMAGCMEH